MFLIGMSARTRIFTQGLCVNSRCVCHVTTRALGAENRRLLIVDYLIPKIHPVFCSLYWVLCTSTSAGLLNVADISECREKAILSYQRREYRWSRLTVSLSKLKMNHAMASVTVGWNNQNQQVFISAWRTRVIPHERSVNSHSGPKWKSATGHSSR